MVFIDKINPDLPEGRLLIRNGEFILKYPDAEVSKVPLDKKWEKLLKYIWKILCKLSHFIGRLKPTIGIAAKW